VSLGNVLSAAAPKEVVPFIRDEDQDVFDRRKDDSFEVQVCKYGFARAYVR